MDQEQGEQGPIVAKQTGDRPKITQNLVKKQNNEDTIKNNPLLKNSTYQLR